MKAALLTGIRQMELRDVSDPEITGDTDVLIRMDSVGVCGSDVHYYVNGRIGSQVVQYPFAVGHEGAGVVEQTGPAVTRVKPGDRIAIEPAVSCWKCDQCLAGRPHTCRNLKFLGCPGQLDGCFSELIVMPQECCYPIPESMTLEQAALSEPLSIGVYAVKLAAMDMTATKIGILGSGPIGLSVMLAARAAGAKTIYLTDRLDYRVEAARRQQVTWAGTPEEVESGVGNGQMDIVFECCGKQEALDQALELLKPGGKLMLIGIPTVNRVSFNIDRLRHQEICIQNVRRQNHCVQPALDLIADGFIQPDFMATHRFTLEQVKEAFELVADYRDGVIKAMIHLE